MRRWSVATSSCWHMWRMRSPGTSPRSQSTPSSTTSPPHSRLLGHSSLHKQILTCIVQFYPVSLFLIPLSLCYLQACLPRIDPFFYLLVYYHSLGFLSPVLLTICLLETVFLSVFFLSPFSILVFPSLSCCSGFTRQHWRLFRTPRMTDSGSRPIQR